MPVCSARALLVVLLAALLRQDRHARVDGALGEQPEGGLAADRLDVAGEHGLGGGRDACGVGRRALVEGDLEAAEGGREGERAEQAEA